MTDNCAEQAVFQPSLNTQAVLIQQHPFAALITQEAALRGDSENLLEPTEAENAERLLTNEIINTNIMSKRVHTLVIPEQDETLGSTNSPRPDFEGRCSGRNLSTLTRTVTEYVVDLENNVNSKG